MVIAVVDDDLPFKDVDFLMLALFNGNTKACAEVDDSSRRGVECESNGRLGNIHGDGAVNQAGVIAVDELHAGGGDRSDFRS